MNSANDDDREHLDPGIGVVIVDHGSRRPEANAMLEAVAELYGRLTGTPIVEPAHMDLVEPSLAAAFNRCVLRGAHTVVIHPYFLLPGRHWSDDIPRLAAAAAARHPKVAWLVTAPLGLHEGLVGVIDDRVRHCLACARGEIGPCEVCEPSGGCRFSGSIEQISADGNLSENHSGS
jgi:sirohydrochlorin ferrochelatase